MGGEHHDASTSRRLNVTKLQRRDVSAISCSTIIKRKRDQKSRASKNIRTRARKAEQQRTRLLEKTLAFVFSSFMKDC